MEPDQDRLTALSELENRLGLFFENKTYLHQALTHSSYAHRFKILSNERLEFLGDSVLELVTSDLLFFHFPHENEGFLTKTRASLVNQTILSGLALKFHLHEYLLAADHVMGSGNHNQAVLADTFEAVLGAIYLQLGYEEAANWLKPHIQVFLSRISDGILDTDYKSRLQVFMQKKYRELPVYRLIRVEGPEHNQLMFVEVFLKNEIYGKGEGRSKKEAEQMAAYAALQKLKQEGFHA